MASVDQTTVWAVLVKNGTEAGDMVEDAASTAASFTMRRRSKYRSRSVAASSSPHMAASFRKRPATSTAILWPVTHGFAPGEFMFVL